MPRLEGTYVQNHEPPPQVCTGNSNIRLHPLPGSTSHCDQHIAIILFHHIAINRHHRPKRRCTGSTYPKQAHAMWPIKQPLPKSQQLPWLPKQLLPHADKLA